MSGISITRAVTRTEHYAYLRSTEMGDRKEYWKTNVSISFFLDEVNIRHSVPVLIVGAGVGEYTSSDIQKYHLC